MPVNSNAQLGIGSVHGDRTCGLIDGAFSIAVRYAILNSADAGAGLSLVMNGMVVSSSAGPRNVRATKSFSTGKYYWETFTLQDDSVITNFGRAGFCNGSQSLSATLGASVDGVGINPFDGVVQLNGSTLATIGDWKDIGEGCQIAVDGLARLLWARPNGSGNWNGSGAADPVTGAGGLDISAVTGALFPSLGIAASTGPGADYAVNLGSVPFTYTVPAGFSGLKA